MNKNELQNILRGTRKVSRGNLIQAAAGYLRRNAEAGEMAGESKRSKKEEATRLRRFAADNHLFFQEFSAEKFVSEGAEQKVFIADENSVFKLNDAIYFENWTDYFYNLLLNNYFFPETAYELKGFVGDNETLYAVVHQDFIKADQPTDLGKVKVFMETNGFRNIRNHDYVNDELGIILEDLHDENVLTKKGMLYFIDTVFFLKSNFWN